MIFYGTANCQIHFFFISSSNFSVSNPISAICCSVTGSRKTRDHVQGQRISDRLSCYKVRLFNSPSNGLWSQWTSINLTLTNNNWINSTWRGCCLQSERFNGEISSSNNDVFVRLVPDLRQMIHWLDLLVIGWLLKCSKILEKYHSAPVLIFFWHKIYFLRYFDGSFDNKKSFLPSCLFSR